MRIQRASRGVAGTVLVLGVLAASLLGGAPAWKDTDRATPSLGTEATTDSAPRDAVRLQLVIGTTSDWTVARLAPGDVLAATVRSTSNASVSRAGGAWQVTPVQPGTQAWATVEAVVYEPKGQDVVLTVDKGYVGRTRVAITDVQRGESIITATNDAHSSTDPANQRQWTLSHDEVYVEPIDLPRATSEQQVLAFYYPWFDAYDDSRLTDRPATPRSTFARRDVRDMTRQAAGAGVDGFVVSWAGAASDGTGFDLALDAAEAEDQVITGYLEVPRAVGLSAEQGPTVYAWLRELLRRAESPAFLRHDGTPVVFVYAMEQLPAWMWATMRNQLAAEGQDVLLVGDTGRPEFAGVTWGEHRYSALGSAEERAAHARRQALALRAATAVEGADPMAWVATVAPGYDDHLVRDGNPVVARDGGQRYEDTWDAAVASDPDWIVVTSWNEWYEGTSIEPSEQFGDLALQQTRERVAAWTGESTSATTGGPRGRLLR